MTSSLYCDTRLGGTPSHVLTDKPESFMQIPDEIRKCVLFIGYKKSDGGIRLAGTGFFISKPTSRENYRFAYLVTAKHVIDGIRDKLADKVYLRMNHVGTDAAVWVETDINGWMFHPDDSECDVAILGVSLYPTYDHRALPIETFVTPEVMAKRNVGVGSEIFFAGLFAQHHGQRKNIPIIRVGNISAMPGEEKVETRFGLIDAYLVEARSLGGISGSPVFVMVPVFRPEQGDAPGSVKLVNIEEFFLLGLMHGHWDMDYETDLASDDAVEDAASRVRSVNVGIAIVVPSTKILEVLNQPMVKRNEKKLEDDYRKGRLPKSDSALNDDALTKETFEDTLKRASRKVSEPESKEPTKDH